MEYRIVFYATETGEKPMLDFLESLRGKNDVLHKLVTTGLLTSSSSSIGSIMDHR